MAIRFSETIRRLMGWCPNAAMVGRRYVVPEDEIRTAGGGREVVEGALVDYGPIGTPGRLFLLLLGGAGLIGCLYATAPATLVTVPITFVMPPAGGLLLLAIMLGYAVLELYGTVRRASIDIARDTVTISRPLYRPIVIPKGAIETVEVKENRLPIAPWLLAIALAVLLVSAVGNVYAGLGNPASMQFFFGLAAIIFFPVLFYRTYLRNRYPQTLVITTAEKKIAAIYTDDPGRIVRVLEMSS